MLNKVSENILLSRYVQKDSSKTPIETIDQLWQRVAKHASSVEQGKDKDHWYNVIYGMLSTQTFLFNSPTLVNAGTGINGLSACFVVGMEDSIEGIWSTKEQYAKVAQKGGGCGLNICDLRPKNAPVSGSTHARAGGPIAFLETIWHDMEAMTQAGFRAMACMAVMRVDHPDIMDFIHAKSPERALAAQLHCSINEASDIWSTIRSSNKLTEEQQSLIRLSERYLSNFNISVGITDAFMHALQNDDTIDLTFDDVVYDTVKASDIWDALVHNAHASGDPGLLFLDVVNDTSPYRYSNQILKATNPCGEQPLPPHGVCNLGSIDVSKFVRDGIFDWEGYHYIGRAATHALNNICDVASWPTIEIKAWVEENKPIGLGIMGYADALLAQGLRYGSPQALDFAKELVSRLYDAAELESIELGKERGIPKACLALPTPRRNVTLLSIAPTGTISLIAGCSSGCEPVFQYVQVRKDTTGTYLIIHPAIKQALNVDDEVYPVGHDIKALQHRADEIIKEATMLSDIYVDASALSVKEHILTQAAFQNAHGDGRAVDSAVSKTINLPANASVSDVHFAYRFAYSSGCKGITIYRDGSKFVQVLNRSEQKEIKAEKDYTVVDAKRYKVKYKGDRWYVIIGLDDGTPTEIFTVTSREDDSLPTTDALSRMISLALRYGAPVEKVVSQLRKVRQYSITSFPAILARILDQYTEKDTTGLQCSVCQSTNVELVGGCPTCKDCGYSKCS